MIDNYKTMIKICKKSGLDPILAIIATDTMELLKTDDQTSEQYQAERLKAYDRIMVNYLEYRP